VPKGLQSERLGLASAVAVFIKTKGDSNEEHAFGGRLAYSGGF
jgi:hypothetical protein